MSKLFFLIPLFLLAKLTAFANPQDTLAAANALYEKGEYTNAVETYERLVETGFESEALFYNLGNAYYKSGQVGKSILNYERARLLDPDDEDIQQNLEIAGLSTVDRFEVLPKPLITTAYQGFFCALSPSNWAIVALMLLAMSTVSLWFYFFGSNKRLAFILSTLSFGLFAVSLFMGYQHYGYQQNNQAAIVMEASSYAKSGPSVKAEDVFILHEGTKVNVIEHFGEWYKVRLPDGKIGWLGTQDLALVHL